MNQLEKDFKPRKSPTVEIIQLSSSSMQQDSVWNNSRKTISIKEIKILILTKG